MNENQWKSNWVRETQRAGGYARRIEDKYALGFPDMIVQPPHYGICFIEVKLVTGRYFGPTPRQLIELQLLNAMHGGHFEMIIGYDDDIRTFYISKPLPPPAREQKIDTRECWASAAPFIDAIRKFIDEQ